MDCKNCGELILTHIAEVDAGFCSMGCEVDHERRNEEAEQE